MSITENVIKVSYHLYTSYAYAIITRIDILPESKALKKCAKQHNKQDVSKVRSNLYKGCTKDTNVREVRCYKS